MRYSRVHVSLSGASQGVTEICSDLHYSTCTQKKRKALFPQQRSSDITQEPRYRKATLRIGECSYIGVRRLNCLHINLTL